MMNWKKSIGLIALAILTLAPIASCGQLTDIVLPPPQTTGGKPLMQALSERRSSRAFSEQPLTVQVMSDLLWAAFGINRKESGKRTAPTARDWQEIEIYVVTSDGAYLYDASTHSLRALKSGDHRKRTGGQAFVTVAPVNLVFVADLKKMETGALEDQIMFSAAATGCISQNVYLYCASAGLATVVRASIDRKDFAAAFDLPSHKRVILAQTVGYPATGGK